MASFSHALSPELITFFSVFITPKDFARAHATLFFLEELFGKAFVIWFIAFPKLVRLILGGEMLVGVPCKIFSPSCQRRVASRCFDETCFGSDGSCMIVLGVALLLCTLPGYFSFAALSILTVFACSISLSLLVRFRHHLSEKKDIEFKGAISN